MELIHADLFFFIASIATIVISILIAVALVLLIGILRDIREGVERVKGAGERLASWFPSLKKHRSRGKVEES